MPPLQQNEAAPANGSHWGPGERQPLPSDPTLTEIGMTRPL
jgi:hypothetical protein